MRTRYAVTSAVVIALVATHLLTAIPLHAAPAAPVTLFEAIAALEGLSGRDRPQGSLRGSAWSTGMLDLIQQSEYAIRTVTAPSGEGAPWSYQAANRAHGLRSTFSTGGVEVVPRTAAESPWRCELALVGFGQEGDARPVSEPSPVVQGNRVGYERAELSEWYVNDRLGLEQGFALAVPFQPGQAEGPVQLDLALRGDLSAALLAGGRGVELTTPDGLAVLRYSLIEAHDANDQTLDAAIRLAGGCGGSLSSECILSLALAGSGTRYPLTISFRISAAVWKVEGDQPGAYLGRSVASAGDVNGDGYDDVIVGAYYFDTSQVEAGKVFVFYGSASGLGAAPDWVAEGDKAKGHLGSSVATAGDVNGDGYDDVIIGAPDYSNGQTYEGRAYVYHGSPSGLGSSPAWMHEVNASSAYFGAAVSTAGDVNGDGYSDVIVGAPGANSLGGWAGSFYGSAGGLSTFPDWYFTTGQVNAFYGYSVGTAGDVNGDGFDDVVFGAPFCDRPTTDEGLAVVCHGSASGLSKTANWTDDSDQEKAYFGRSVSTAGDVNGDGYDDVIVGADGYDKGQSGEGRAFVYHGSPSGLSTSRAWTAEGDQVDAAFGLSVGTAGDANGDAFGDVIVGSPEYSLGEDDEGAAFLYVGSASGLGATAEWVSQSDQSEADFGYSVAKAGDVTGDGYTDLIVGARHYDGELENEGAAFVYFFGPVMVADFSGTPTSGAAPLAVTFTDLSIGDYDTCAWSFGDGGTSAECDPAPHTYVTAGSYTVALTVSGPGGTDTETKADYITVYAPAVAQFSGTPTSGVAPLAVTFTDLSTGEYDTCAWDFGDGFTSAECDPAPHTYVTAGSYTVALTVSGPGGTDTETKADYITVYAPAVAQFSGTPTSGVAPLAVTFTDLSTGDYDTCSWSFGDGGISSECDPAPHTYTTAGSYTVALTVSGPGGTDTETKADYITVYAPAVAQFSGTPASGVAPLAVTFTDLSTGDYDTCSWSFGDGGTSAECDPAPHTYTTAGSYTVALTVSGPGGTDTETKADYITVYAPAAAQFSGTPTSGVVPLAVTFTNLSSGEYDTCAWDFGDGGTSSECDPAPHTYTTAGSYTVALTVSGPGGTDTETKADYVTVHAPAVAQFSGTPTSGVAPLAVTFTNLSSGEYDTCAWSFGDGGTSSECAPAPHTYITAGSYTVALTVSGPGGTDTETKVGYITVYAPAVAQFSGTPTSGVAPLAVTFTNLSSGEYDTCSWSFGDGGTSADCDPAPHTYTAAGSYTVALTVSGPGGTDTETKVGYITVSPRRYVFMPIVMRNR